MWFLLYFCNLIFALVIALPFKSWLDGAAGQSLMLTDVREFDFVLLTDVLRNYSGFGVLISQFLTLAFVYLIFSAFLMGGIVHTLVQTQPYTLKEFIGGALKYFWRMFLLSICFMLLLFLLPLIALMSVAMNGIDLTAMENDVEILGWMKIILIGYSWIPLLIVIIHDYAKIFLVSYHQEHVGKAILGATRFVFGHFGSVLLLYLLNVALLLMVFALYKLLKIAIPAIGSGSILLAFVLSQALLLGRIVIKLLILSSANTLVKVQVQAQVQAQSER